MLEAKRVHELEDWILRAENVTEVMLCAFAAFSHPKRLAAVLQTVY